jgi:Bacterial CdiA-CT RNAse A domain
MDEFEALEREHLVLKRMVADLKLDLWRREFARKAGFNPEQPRGELGRWTSNGGSDLSGPAGDVEVPPRVRLAQADTLRQYSIDLNEEEARGGHTLRDHVGKTGDELLSATRTDRGEAGAYRYARQRQGSFESRESANDFVNRTLGQNRELVDSVASGSSERALLNSRFGFRTGIEAFRPDIDAEPYLRQTYEVGVDIRHDPRTERGYRVNSAYPRNSRAR